MVYFFGFLGGLALFLYGMQLMGEGLQRAAGEKLQKILEKLTGVLPVAVALGAVVTGILQSSSATTVMTVGFVNAGLMNLKQAFGVVMGANIGTTMTAQLIAFKLTDYITLFLAIGFAVHLLAKRQRGKYIGQVILGFGILMLGMEMMSDSVMPLREYQGFIDFIGRFSDNPDSRRGRRPCNDHGHSVQQRNNRRFNCHCQSGAYSAGRRNSRASGR